LGKYLLTVEKKSFQTRHGKIAISNRSDFGKLVQGFAISPMLQEMMVYVGQMETYGKGCEVWKNWPGLG